MWTCLKVKVLEESLTSRELTSSNSVLGIFLYVLRSFSEAIWMFWSFVQNLPRGCRWLAHSHCFLLSLYACFLSSFQSSPALLVYYLHFTYFLSCCTCVLLCLIRQACCIIHGSDVYIYIYMIHDYTCLDTRFILWCHIWWYDLIRRVWYFLPQYILTLSCTGRGQGDEKPLAPTVLRGLNEECARRWPAQDVSGRLGPCTREATWSNGSVDTRTTRMHHNAIVAPFAFWKHKEGFKTLRSNASSSFGEGDNHTCRWNHRKELKLWQLQALFSSQQDLEMPIWVSLICAVSKYASKQS